MQMSSHAIRGPYRLAGSLAATALVASSLLSDRAIAQTSSEMKPVAVIAASSYNELIGDIDFLGELGGQQNAGQQLEGMLAMFTQGQGLKGMEKTRAWGAIVQTDGSQFNPVICLPVTDLDAMLAIMENFGMTTSEVGDGIIEIEAPNQSIYVKADGPWAFISQTPEMLEETPADPAPLFDELSKEYDLSVRVMLQNVPDLYRQIAIQQLKAGAEQGLERQPGENDEDYEARRKLTEANIDQLVQMMEELDEITLGVHINKSEGNIHFDFAYSALPNTQAALALSVYRDAKTEFAGCLNSGAAIRFNLTADSPPELVEQQREQAEAQIQSLRQQAMNAIDRDTELPNDEAREALKEAVNDLLDVLQATAVSGHFDAAGFVDLGPQSFSAVAGGFAKETKQIETALKKLAEVAQNEPRFPGVNWNADSHAGTTIHTMAIPVPDDEPQAQEIFGEALDIAVALGDEAVFFAAGQDCMANLKEAIDGSGSAAATEVKPMHMTISLLPIVKMIAESDAGANPAVMAMADALEASEVGADEMHMTAETVDDKLRMRIQLEQGVLKAFAAAGAAARRAGAGAGF